MADTSAIFLFKSGDLFLPKPIRNVLEYYWIGNDSSLFYVSNWSLVHFMSGIGTVILLHYMRICSYYTIVYISFLLHSLWELWQIFVKNTKYWTLRGQIDIVVDTVFYMAGVLLILNFRRCSKRE
jgi:hypothetical protein